MAGATRSRILSRIASRAASSASSRPANRMSASFRGRKSTFAPMDQDGRNACRREVTTREYRSR